MGFFVLVLGFFNVMIPTKDGNLISCCSMIIKVLCDCWVGAGGGGGLLAPGTPGWSHCYFGTCDLFCSRGLSKCFLKMHINTGELGVDAEFQGL